MDCKNLINLFKKKIKNFIQIGSSMEYGNSRSPIMKEALVSLKEIMA